MVMANPNKTVAAFRRKHPFNREGREPRAVSPFVEWVVAQAQAGVVFQTMAEAEQAYAQALEPRFLLGFLKEAK
jgi:hypothetical protein